MRRDCTILLFRRAVTFIKVTRRALSAWVISNVVPAFLKPGAIATTVLTLPKRDILLCCHMAARRLQKRNEGRAHDLPPGALGEQRLLQRNHHSGLRPDATHSCVEQEVARPEAPRNGHVDLI